MKKIDRIEAELDLHYQGFEIMNYPEEFIIRSAIKCFEDFELSLSLSDDNYFDSFSLLTDSINTLDRCIRWATQNKNKGSMNEVDMTPLKCEEMTCSFFAWGFNYSLLESFHISYRRKLSNVKIDEKTKTVRFEQIPNELLQFSLSQALVSQEESQNILKNIPDSELENITELTQAIINKYISHFESLIFPELEHDFNFDGYTKSDFIKFWTITYLKFRRYVFTKRQKGFSDSYSSDLKEFFRIHSTIIDKESIEKIITDLTFKTEEKASIWYRPFIICNSKLLFSPSLLTSLNPNTMLVGALNKSSKKHIYDNVSNTIESFWTDQIEKILKSNNCFDVMYKKEFVCGTSIKTPDFVLINKNAKELIIIDYKHFSQSIKTYEVFNKQLEIDKAIDQIDGYVKFFKDNKIPMISDEIDISKFEIIPVLLLKNPIPMIKIQKKIKYLNFWVLKKYINAFKVFKEIIEMENVTNKNEEIEPDHFQTSINQIKMNEWTYEYESLAIPK